MISTGVIVCNVITFIICVFGPIAALLVFLKRNKNQNVWMGWLMGMLGFFVTQIVVRLTILNALSTQKWFVDFATNQAVVYVLVLAATAALFELAGRIGALKILGSRLNRASAFAAGLGHGGMEAMFLIGTTYLNNFIYIIMIQMGTFDQMVEESAAAGVDPAALMQIKDAFLTTSAPIFLLAGYERILTMILHTLMTFLLAYYMKNKKLLKGSLICFGIHFMLDGIAGLVTVLAPESMMYYIVYTYLTVFAILGIVILKKIWEKYGGSSPCLY